MLASQPVPAAIHRLAKKANAGAAGRKTGGNRVSGALTAPHRYLASLSFQTSAAQAPVRRREISMPTGQGSVAQHAPQPLQGVPIAGLDGAFRCR